MALRTVTACLIGLFALGGSAMAQLQPTFPNLTYAVVGGRPLQLDLYLPPPQAGPGPHPLVLWIHGGGWSGGSRFPLPQHAALLPPRGIAVASVTYRLTSQAALWGGEPVIFPAQIHDVKGAVRWLRANAATYNLDTSRFGSWGSSAGGHLSALLGTSGGVAAAEGAVGGNLAFSSVIQACADWFGPADLLNMNPDVTTPPGSGINHDAPTSPESRLLGWDDPGQGVGDIRANLGNPNPPYPALVALAALCAPVTHADAGDPPFFIAHGTADTSVPYNQSVRLFDALTGAGAAATLLPVVGAGHGGFPQSVSAAVVDFFATQFGLPTPECPADLNGDGVVGAPDLALLLGSWSLAGPADLDGSGTVGSGDLALLLGAWGVCL